jgi:hypothetical protein
LRWEKSGIRSHRLDNSGTCWHRRGYSFICNKYWPSPDSHWLWIYAPPRECQTKRQNTWVLSAIWVLVRERSRAIVIAFPLRGIVEYSPRVEGTCR